MTTFHFQIPKQPLEVFFLTSIIMNGSHSIIESLLDIPNKVDGQITISRFVLTKRGLMTGDSCSQSINQKLLASVGQRFMAVILIAMVKATTITITNPSVRFILWVSTLHTLVEESAKTLHSQAFIISVIKG